MTTESHDRKYAAAIATVCSLLAVALAFVLASGLFLPAVATCAVCIHAWRTRRSPEDEGRRHVARPRSPGRRTVPALTPSWSAPSGDRQEDGAA